MELTAEITVGDKSHTVTVGTDLQETADVMRVSALVGSDKIRKLADGEWDSDAASAVIYVNIVRALVDEPDWTNPPFKFSDMRLDWGLLEDLMDETVESDLAEMSEEL